MGKTGPDATPEEKYYNWTDQNGKVHKLPAGVDPGWDSVPGKYEPDLSVYPKKIEKQIKALPPEPVKLVKTPEDVRAGIDNIGKDFIKDTQKLNLDLAAIQKEYLAAVTKGADASELYSDMSKIRREIEKAEEIARQAAAKVLIQPEKIVIAADIKKMDNSRKKAINGANKWIEDVLNWQPKKIGYAKTRSRRAYASLNDNTINLNINDGIDAVVHETAHTFEFNDAGILQAAIEFYERRTKGETIKWLGGNLEKNEIGKKDKFFNPYCGKEYKGRDGKLKATEIVSMGIEELWRDPIKFAKSDPDYFDFIYKVLRGDFNG